MTLDNRKRLGIVEVGSYAVRRMVATFEPNGKFRIDGSESDEYIHGVDADNLDNHSVDCLWQAVHGFYKYLLDSGLRPENVWVYGTELCRRLSIMQHRIPTYVIVLNADQEAVTAWATGFLKIQDKVDGWSYTIFDQGGGSSELVSGVWDDRRNRIENLKYGTFDFGHRKLAKLYSPSSPSAYVEKLRNLLGQHTEQIALHEAKKHMSTFILLGGPATKLAFNIRHKRDEDHDYDGRAVDVTTISLKEMQTYYNKVANIYKGDPDRARREVDRRTIRSDEYERVMSSAILLMLISARLGYQTLTVTASSTRYGFGFLAARGIIQNRSSSS
ncbi:MULTISPECIES: hypothetical protein [unclassified Bradyrhizobium]|uniref:hypothetical protein n=1 Tax=unclassified Bradyrhizobium TaxID=2631580 RepID=UPI0028ED1A95|nr:MULTISPECIES: hypothetical protein [unclassified Bradyrhizobium]